MVLQNNFAAEVERQIRLFLQPWFVEGAMVWETLAR